MNSKLILVIDEAVIINAKIYAQENGRNVSELVENYLRILASSKSPNIISSPTVSRLLGSIKLPENFDYKSEL